MMALVLTRYINMDGVNEYSRFYCNDTEVTVAQILPNNECVVRVTGAVIKEYRLNDKEFTEILPNVKVLVGDRERPTLTMIPLVIQAPQSIRIVRGEKFNV